MTDDALIAIEAIKVLKSRYFRYLDTKDYEGLDSLFTDDAVIDIRGSATASNGTRTAIGGLDDRVMTGKEFKAFLRDVNPHFETAHHGHMPEIAIESASTAKGIWALEDRIWFHEGSPFKMMHGWGHYHERYVKENGAWRISAMRITRLKCLMEPWTRDK